MVKLGARFKPGEERRVGKIVQQLGVQPTRADIIRRQEYERRVAEQIRKEKEIEATTERLQNVSLMDYGEAYEQLPEWQKERFKTPEVIEALPEYKKALEQQKSYEQYQSALSSYNADVRDLALARKVMRGSRMTITPGIRKWIIRISEGRDYVGSGPAFRTAEGAILGKGFLRPSPENIEKYGGFTEQVFVDKFTGHITSKPISPVIDYSDITKPSGITKPTPAEEMVSVIDMTARGELTPEMLRPKEVRAGWKPLVSAYEFMKTHPSPQEWLGEKFKGKDFEGVVGAIQDIERARIKESPEISSSGYFFGKLTEGITTSYSDIFKTSTEKAETYFKERKDKPVIKWMVEHKAPQHFAYDYFAKHKAPQERVGEFFVATKPPQEWLGEKLDIPTLKKIPVVDMITDIEIARKKEAPELTSAHFFFGKLFEATPITAEIKKAYKISGKETFREFFTGELGKGYKMAYRDISEWATYKDTKLFARKRDTDYMYQPSSEFIGGVMGGVGKYQLYAMPSGVGLGLFASPFLEKLIVGKGALGKYVKKHPIETTALLTMGAIGMYRPTKELVSVWGKKFIPLEKLTISQILSGKKTFPTAPSKYHLELFKESKYGLPGEKPIVTKLIGYTGKGKVVSPKLYKKLYFKVPKSTPGIWHTTGKEFPMKTFTEIGKSEFAGLYGSHAVSPHFLRVGGEGGYVLFGAGISLKSPAILRITPEEILWGKGVQVKTGKFLRYKWLTDLEKGKAYVPGVKAEVEAIIPPGTEIFRTGAKYYTMWKGHPVPIFQYKTTTGEIITTTFKGKDLSMQIKDINKYYSSLAGEKTYLISPTSMLRASYDFRSSIEKSSSKISESISKSLSKISKVSKPISKVSSIKRWSDIYKPSKFSKPSKVSDISKITSKLKPSKPYKPTSYKPPYKPKPTKRIIPPPFKFPALALPKFPRRIVKRKPRRIFRKPSLWALGMKITAPKMRKFEPSGLIIRPIISKRKRRKGISPLFKRTLKSDFDFWEEERRRRRKPIRRKRRRK